MHNILHERYYNIGKSERYLVQMWSHTKSSRIQLPGVHGVSKNLDPNIKPEKQTIRPLKANEISQDKPRIGQGRARMRSSKPPTNHPIAQLAEPSKENFWGIKNRKEGCKSTIFFATPVQSISNSSMEVINRRTMQKINKDIPFCPDPNYRPPPKPVRMSVRKSRKYRN